MKKNLFIAALLTAGLGYATVSANAAVLKNRYSFSSDQDTSIAYDSVGGQHGTLYGNAVIYDEYDLEGNPYGIMKLDGTGDKGSLTAGTFCALPANIMSTFESFSIETWARAEDGNQGWGRLFDFGNCTTYYDENLLEDRISSGTEYTMIAWGNGIHSLKVNGAESQISTTFPGTASEGFSHIVYTYDGTTGIGTLYINGEKRTSGSQPAITTFTGGMPNMWIGKSNWPDPYFTGTFNEFRIWEGALSDLDVLANYKSGADAIGDLGELQSVTVDVDKTGLLLNERLFPKVTAKYSKMGDVDVTSSTTVTSSDKAIVTATSASLARGLSAGTATLTFSYGGKDVTLDITVSDAIPEIELAHRYSFNGNANDSVGGANATLFNGATVSGGALVLTPEPGSDYAQYAKLPGNMLQNSHVVTFETWFVSDNVSHDYNWGRVFEFSNPTYGEEDAFDGNVKAKVMLAARNGNGIVQSDLNTDYANPSITSASLAEGQIYHFAVVADGINKTFSLYRDGQLVKTEAADASPRDIGNAINAYLGRSGYTDPGFYGKILEFRIWDGAFTGEQVAMSYASGADTLPPISKGDLVGIGISAEKTEMVETAKLPFTVYADYQNIKGVALDINDVVLTTSDESIVGLSIEGANAYALGNGVGFATVTASYAGMTSDIFFVVTAIPEAKLIHRYSFNGDMKDSVGGADGTLYNTEIVDGQLVIDGTGLSSGEADPNDAVPYAELPNTVCKGLESLSIEAWTTIDELRTWMRLFDFGSKSGTAGTKYFFIAPYNYTVGATSANFVTGGSAGDQEAAVYTAGYFMPVNQEVHIVLTQLADARNACLYVDGVLRAKAENIDINPKVIGDMQHCYLGRSLFASDAVYVGKINEFRIWDGALSPAEVGAHYAAGPEVTKVETGDIKDLYIELDSNFASPGTTVAMTVYADYENINKVPVSTMEDIVIYSNNDYITVTSFDCTSAYCAKGTITAEYMGLTATTDITFDEEVATLVHRYSFNDAGYGTIKDSVGNMDGYNYLDIVDGALIMDGSAYAELPEGILADVAGESFAFETWVDIDENTAGDWSRLNVSFYDPAFTPNDGGTFTLGFQPNKGGSSHNNSVWAVTETTITDSTTHNYKTELFALKGAPGAGVMQYVYQIDLASKLMKVYANGYLENEVSMTLTSDYLAENMPLYMCSLGVNPLNGKGTAGKMLEFRIWKGVMTPAQVMANYVAGTEVMPNVAGQPDGLSIEIPATVPAGATTLLAVSASFDDTEILATDTPGIVITSSDDSIVTIDDQKRIVGIAPGTATITATYKEGVSASAEITVTEDQSALLHRYSFNEAGENTAGVGDIRIFGNSQIVDGQLVLDGSRQAFAQAPAGIISGLKSMTWEAWFTPGDYVATWNRLLDFSDANDQGNGTDYVFLSIYTGGAYFRSATKSNSGSEYYYDFNMDRNMKDLTGVKVYLAVSFDENGKMVGYKDGAKLTNGTVTATQNPLYKVSDKLNYIGRSSYIGDPEIKLSLDEFRIWNGVLTEEEIAANFAAGPDALPTPTEEASIEYAIDEEGNMVIIFTGSLQEADTADGEYQTINASSPYTVAPVEGSKFFRAISK